MTVAFEADMAFQINIKINKNKCGSISQCLMLLSINFIQKCYCYYYYFFEKGKFVSFYHNKMKDFI